jgi:RNA polymerase sigma factor (sigma-70 family)
MAKKQVLEATGRDSRAAVEKAGKVKQLFDDHNRTLLSFLRARLRNDAEAHDVAQEAYVRLLELDNLNVISYQRAYLFRVAANLAVDRLRHRSICETDAPDNFLAAFADDRCPERDAMAVEELALIRQVLVELSPKCRNAFLWHVFDGQSTVTIAKRMNLSDRMVRLYIAETLTTCRARIDAASGKATAESP